MSSWTVIKQEQFINQCHNCFSALLFVDADVDSDKAPSVQLCCLAQNTYFRQSARIRASTVIRSAPQPHLIEKRHFYTNQFSDTSSLHFMLYTDKI